MRFLPVAAVGSIPGLQQLAATAALGSNKLPWALLLRLLSEEINLLLQSVCGTCHYCVAVCRPYFMAFTAFASYCSSFLFYGNYDC